MKRGERGEPGLPIFMPCDPVESRVELAVEGTQAPADVRAMRSANAAEERLERMALEIHDRTRPVVGEGCRPSGAAEPPGQLRGDGRGRQMCQAQGALARRQEVGERLDSLVLAAATCDHVQVVRTCLSGSQELEPREPVQRRADYP